jgi:hypothetical protein
MRAARGGTSIAPPAPALPLPGISAPAGTGGAAESTWPSIPMPAFDRARRLYLGRSRSDHEKKAAFDTVAARKVPVEITADSSHRLRILLLHSFQRLGFEEHAMDTVMRGLAQQWFMAFDGGANTMAFVSTLLSSAQEAMQIMDFEQLHTTEQQPLRRLAYPGTLPQFVWPSVDMVRAESSPRTRMCIYSHTYIHTYICIHIHTHTYIHTYIYTHTQVYTRIHNSREEGCPFIADTPSENVLVRLGLSSALGLNSPNATRPGW